MNTHAHLPGLGETALLEILHQGLPHGVAILDDALRLVFANARWSDFAEQIGGTPEPPHGTPFAGLIPDIDGLHQAAERSIATGQPHDCPGLPITTDAGESFWDLTFGPLTDKGRIVGMKVIAHEATERVLASRAAAAGARLAAFRAGVSQALASSDDIGAVLQSCAEAMVRHAHAAFARIWELDEADDAYHLRASAGLYTRLDGTYSRIPAEWIRQKTFGGHAPAIAIDILKTHHVREPEWAAENGLVAWANQPLVVRGQIIGFISMFARQNFDQDTLEELGTVADAIAQFIERKRTERAALEGLEERVSERTRELSLLLDISRNVASTLELRPLLELILEQLQTVIPYTGTAVLTIEGDDLIFAGQHGPLPEESAHKIRYPIAQMAPVWGRFEAGEAIIIPDVRGDSPEAEVFRSVVGADLDDQLAFIGSCLWAPLQVKDQLIGIMSITNTEIAIFTPQHAVMAGAIARQAAVAIENARLFEQVRGMAALEERQRLARELHDSVSQALFGIGLGAETAKAMLAKDPVKAAPPIDYVLQLAKGGMAEMRALIFELRPESLELEGLVAALDKQATATGVRHGIAVELSLCPEPEIPLDQKEALYRIAQEAMHNTAKHAEAEHVTLRLATGPDCLALDVIDDGNGFDTGGSFPGHLGLVSMRERIARFGGTVEIASAPGAGTRVHVTLPVVAP
jgi:signal transduction histidine kinase